MTTVPIGHPRRIDPSLIEIGDDISVEHKASRGITTTLRGIVSKRVDSGSTRHLMTEEGATLIAWEASSTKLVKVTLFGRELAPQATLFDNMDEIKNRIAS